MDYKKLAEMLFPDNKLTVEEIEKKYKKRNMPQGAYVTRFAPSPTGYGASTTESASRHGPRPLPSRA